MAAALDGNPATLKERPLSVLALGFAVEEFKEKIQIWGNLQIRLTKDSKITDIKNQVKPNILGSHSKVMKYLAKEKGTRRAKSPGYMFSEDDYLSNIWLRADLVASPVPVDFFLWREKLTRLQLTKLQISHH